MLISMTGFGRATLDARLGKLIVEIQSVNRKYLEVSVSLPKELGRFDPEVRKLVGEAISRGQVTVRIYLMPNSAAVAGLLPDVAILKELKKGWERIAKDLSLDAKNVDLPFLLQNLPAQQTVEFARDEDLSTLSSVVKEALEGIVQMKRKEGKALAQDLTGRLAELERMVRLVETLSPDASQKMRQKLLERMEEVLKFDEATQERLLREVALFAEKIDVTEEITRFHSHLAQFRGLLNPKEGGVGRKMDFLIQEMGREVNTIGSKCLESKISHLVVEMKSELEKMREQIQNIE